MYKIRNHLVYAFGISVNTGETLWQVDDKVDFASCGKWLQSFNWRQYSFTHPHRLKTKRNLT